MRYSLFAFLSLTFRHPHWLFVIPLPPFTMLAPEEIHFGGWTARNKYCIDGQTLEEQDFAPRAFTESDVDILISHCGVSG